MCREVSDNERLEHRLEELKQQVDVNEAIQDFADAKMREQLELLEERIADLEEQLLEMQDFRHFPQKKTLEVDCRSERKEQKASEKK